MWFLYAFYAVHETESLNPARGRVTVATAEPAAPCIACRPLHGLSFTRSLH
jgi:hypothetical protein